VEEIQQNINSYLEIINSIYQDLLIEYLDKYFSMVCILQNDNGEIGYDKVEGNNNMKEKIINILYNIWESDTEDKQSLLNDITANVNNGGKGVETLIDWCISDYDKAKEEYATAHNMTEDEMNEFIDSQFGNLDFLGRKDIDRAWDICNWLLDYINGNMDEETILSLIGE